MEQISGWDDGVDYGEEGRLGGSPGTRPKAVRHKPTQLREQTELLFIA